MFSKLPLLIFIMTVLASCGGKKENSNVSLKIIGANMVNSGGAYLNGGVLIFGRSEDGLHSFRTGLADPNAEISIALAKGRWQFGAISWEGTHGILTGRNRCAVTSAELKTDEMNISFDLGTDNCLRTFNGRNFSNLDFRDASGEFQVLNPVTCLDEVKDSVDCDPVNNRSNLVAYRIAYRGELRGAVEGRVEPLLSGCYLFGNTSYVKAPVTEALFGNPLGIDVVVFKNSTCDGIPVASFDFKGGIKNSAAPFWNMVSDSSDVSNLYFNPSAKFNPLLTAEPTSLNLLNATTTPYGESIKDSVLRFTTTVPANAHEMCLTTAASCPVDQWMPANSSGVISMSTISEGAHTIRLFFRTEAGTVSSPFSDAIYYDTTAPLPPTITTAKISTTVQGSWTIPDDSLFKDILIDFCTDVTCSTVRASTTSTNLASSYSKSSTFLLLNAGDTICIRATVRDEFLRTSENTHCIVYTP